MIASITTTLAKNAVKANILDSVTHFVIKNASGEFFRKAPANIEQLSTWKKKYTLYLTELEANTIITSLAIVVNGTAASGSGTEIATQPWSWDKTTGPQSGYYYYTLEVV